MKTSKQWWEEVKADPVKFTDWLQDQYHGEATAVDRITEFAKKFTTPNTPQFKTLMIIANQELTHASWVAELLAIRGLTPKRLVKDERYWNETLKAIEDVNSFEYTSAVAAHAEQMRLERIKVITEDETAPQDIREVFQKIWKDEEFHARTFASFAGEQAMQQALGSHEKGLEALGLTI